MVFASRLAVVFLGLAAFCASVFATKFLSVALWAYTVYGAAITPALLAAFFWKRATGAGAACAIAGATITTIVWKLSIQKLLTDYAERLAERKGAFVDGVHTISELDAIVPALAVSLILLIGVSLLTPKPKREQWEPFAS